jgi:hypothetical protein
VALVPAETVNGGHTDAHPPVHAIVPPLSFVLRYNVIPLESTSTAPTVVLLPTPTVAVVPGAVVAAAGAVVAAAGAVVVAVEDDEEDEEQPATISAAATTVARVQM